MTTESDAEVPSPLFDLRDVYEERIAPRIREIMQECSDLNLPISMMCTVLNRKDDDGREVFAVTGYTVGSPIRMGIEHLIVGAYADSGFRDYLNRIYNAFLHETTFSDLPDKTQDDAEWLGLYKAAAAACVLDDIAEMANGKLAAEVHHLRDMVRKMKEFVRANPEKTQDLPPMFNMPPEN